ncbi:NAD(P)H-quinone oxidoreductase subunit 3 [Campylobacter ureolyticus]|uniref:NADH-quinone oxidoreductase subunit A n=1 Tax=Campylobacter ureolyticus TaxID=827 RepID=A0AAE7JQN6_9BACT|nr:NAD(P)H-quinone oxidoreductase subunit 3 [Campylobacter ureolyticus]MCR8685288.1 NAD(P)H-quinone oxidoreductase subunit 3 [Campylobacter ureolyticus]MCZ6106090.1 NAD(P)H-quinone oxidoreductase subunit 3 [Campylobacter ureolyticus]MCZ6158695.1 NAD(P)H-quinone oxidoreductase subunit 3 [Campylobacter ureolyticus]QKF85168.1 NADH:quinone oxidoreductase I, membrane subunit A [Campylobacter ureolyticus]QQY36353.1 NAD(P)H-quinone oxidoreductase subunit 3 [Campylobacter ureolyticus]
MSHMYFAHPYFGAFIMLVLSFVIFGLITELSVYLGNKFANKNDELLKNAIYESGPASVIQPNRINSNFYLIAVLFILFDVEIIFMFPWAVNFKILGIFGLIEMILFLAFLAIGFVYAWHKGALDWIR